jgi:iron complex outermembrane recepter protein
MPMSHRSVFVLASSVIALILCPGRALPDSSEVVFQSVARISGPEDDAIVAEAEAVEGEDLSADSRDARPEGPKAVSAEFMIGAMMTTARRRIERVQNVPVSVTGFTQEQLDGRAIDRLSDLNGVVPNLTIDNAIGTANAARISLRGAGIGENIASLDPAVGLFVNGVYAPRTQGMLAAVYDVERVEVVRGPQGTLFGKNTIGGAINVVTRKPSFDFGGKAEARFGNFDQMDTRFVLNVPIVDERAALRVALATRYDDGYQKNVLLGERAGNDRMIGGRAELLLYPASSLEVMLTADVSRQNRRPQAGRCLRINDPSTRLPAEFRTVFFASNGECDATAEMSELKSISDLRSAKDDLRATVLSTQVTWEINDALSLRSISSIRHQRDDVRLDFDAGSFPVAQPLFDGGKNDQRAYTQELQLNGTARANRLTYVLGLYAFGEEVDENTPGSLGSVAAGLATAPGQSKPTLPVLDEVLSVNNRSYAAYGQINYALTDKLGVSAGLRRTLERKRVRKRDIALTEARINLDSLLNRGTLVEARPGDVIFDLEKSRRTDDFSPYASLSYRFTPSLFTYASYATGFRSGGLNGRVSIINGDTEPLDPEKLTTYEVGLKSTFFEDRLLINAAGFFSIYDDIQRPIFTFGQLGAPTIVLRNAAESRIRGFELEVAAQPLPELRLESAVSTFNSRYTEFDFSIDPTIEDERLPFMPRYQFSVAAEYELALGGLGALGTRVQWAQRGAQSNDTTDSRSIRTSKYGLLDARLAWKLPDEQTEIAFWGTNLLNRLYINNGIDVRDSSGAAITFQAPPRRYGVELKRSF